MRSKSKSDSGEVKVMLIDKKTNGSNVLYDDQIEKKQIENQIERKNVENCEVAVISHPQIEINKTEKRDVSVCSHPGLGKGAKEFGSRADCCRMAILACLSSRRSHQGMGAAACEYI